MMYATTLMIGVLPLAVWALLWWGSQHMNGTPWAKRVVFVGGLALASVTSLGVMLGGFFYSRGTLRRGPAICWDAATNQIRFPRAGESMPLSGVRAIRLIRGRVVADPSDPHEFGWYRLAQLVVESSDDLSTPHRNVAVVVGGARLAKAAHRFAHAIGKPLEESTLPHDQCPTTAQAQQLFRWLS